MLLGSDCAVCGGAGCGRLHGPLCERCVARLEPAGALPPGPLPLLALVRYEGVGRELVTTLKYRNGRRLVVPLGPLLASLVAACPADLVTWVPASRAGRRARGFDQGRLLARVTAQATALPARRLLRRGRDRPQVGRAQAARRAGPDLSARGPGGARVVVVDDVITTGSTMVAAARALGSAGWRPVAGVAVAATPLRAGRAAAGSRAGR